MGKTNELITLIRTELKTLGYSVYYDDANDEAEFPYIVFELNLFKYEQRDNNTLIVDVWDNNPDTTEIEDIADNIETLLDYKNIPTNKLLPTFYLNTRNNVTDPDKELKRRQLRFEVQNYYIGG